MVGFLAVGAFSAAVVGVSTYCVIQLQKAESKAARNEFEKYRVDAGVEMADLNAQAKKAELALQEYKQPRTPKESFAKIISGATPATVEILYVKECSDCFWLAQFLSGPLENAKWKVTRVAPVDTEAAAAGRFPTLPAVVSLHANPWGITVVTKGGLTEGSPGLILMGALADSFGGGSAVGGNADNDMPDDMIRIVIAPKA